MEKGFIFNNAGMRLTCLAWGQNGERNVGLFQRGSDGMYITARNTSKDRDGTYSWAWGHYFTSYETAHDDYEKRLQELFSYAN
ncbi:MAG: hypothetical protein IJY39_05140 [Clostridia bacterium]|nr:hypothetical protein [Clostridia bacterium]MBQ8408230.1 hypothetical protein [Clostridia bacterium]